MGDTVEVDGDRFAGQAWKPSQSQPWWPGLGGDGQLPVLQVDGGGGAGRQDRDVLGQVLAWRQLGARAFPPAPEPRDTVLMFVSCRVSRR